MKTISHRTVMAVLASCGMAHGSPVLLATASGELTSPMASSVQSVTLTSYLRYQRVADDRFDMFDHEPILLWRDDPPLSIHGSVASTLDDSDFDTYAEFLTNGTYEMLFFFSPEVGAVFGGLEEHFLQLHVPEVSQVDLFGYQIDRIDQHVTYELNDLGLHVRGRFEFYGSVIPCPPTLLLLALGSLTVFRPISPTNRRLLMKRARRDNLRRCP